MRFVLAIAKTIILVI